MLGIEGAFNDLRKRNKVLFTFIIAMAIILVWKGAWAIFDIIFDELLFQGHSFWGNLIALLIGIGILSAAGIALDRLA